MKKIVIKESDRLVSTVHKDRVVSEYIIYIVVVLDGQAVIAEAHTEIGDDAKKLRVNELIVEHFMTDGKSLEELNENIDIQEISFEENLT